MSDQEDTLRSRKYYDKNEQKQIKQHGADELAAAPEGGEAPSETGKQSESREQMDVDEKHKTEKMRKGHRGTFP